MSEQSRSSGARRRRRSKPTQERFEFPNGWGGRRKGSGPKRRGERANVSHRTRAFLGERLPVEVTMRVKSGLPSLRGSREFEALRAAMVAGCERDGFRLIHFSVLSNQCVQKGRRVQQETDLSGQEPPPCSLDGEPTRERRLEAHRQRLLREGARVLGP